MTTTPMEIYSDTYTAIGYDLSAAIAEYQAALEALAEDEPGPGSPSALVVRIVKEHGGEFVIIPPPPAVEPQSLPTDSTFYRSPAEQAQIQEVK